MADRLPLDTEFLFRLTIEVGAPAPVGDAGDHELRIVPITGGRFEGPRLSGTILPGGADWLRVEPDGTARIDVRLTLQDASGALIYVQYQGVRTGPAAVLERLAKGEAVPASDYYFRAAMRFETAAPALRWLNRTIAIATGQRPPSGPCYDVYAVK
ncbi:DUF3237 domain-containing protein [Plastoroseomonas hellenica]|uniref:DUF3237 domain-containing protein n=1 Tax=Plastoroseomonas hellenica TaxID=2687306 RepID=UPI001BA595F8|nr:DUF3237 domain-containing protein [Plastoroseomonas hellenica]MBR0643397.1 DUF3237 domain-containing protein [Plastoroseomonas hellenica]